MKFNYYVVGGSSYIEAVFESDDHKTGVRQEGPGTEITNRNPLVFFDKAFGDLHPDVIGAVCLSIFYPYIGRKVRFPKAVSPRLVDSMSRQIFTKVKSIEVENVDDSLPRYVGDGTSVLAYGGGVDSTAVRAFFPDSFVVHEASISNGAILPDATNEIVSTLEREGRGSLVTTNQRYISSPGGWHVWICSTITAVLTAASRGASYVLTGSNLGSSFLRNGARYFDRHLGTRHHGASGNYWEQIFWDIGLPVFSPVLGVSEILSMKVCSDSGLLNEVNFCTALHGRACMRCAKCFRRFCISHYLGIASPDYDLFKSEGVLKVLSTKPTYFGHLYAAMLNSGWLPPSWIGEHLDHLPKKTTFPLGFYQDASAFWPIEIRERYTKALKAYVRPMTESEVGAMREWNMAPD